MEAARTRLNEKIDVFVQEELEHTAEIVFSLLKVANEGGDIASHIDTSSAVSSTQFFPRTQHSSHTSQCQDAVTRVTSPAHWAPVKAALIRSIRTGVFFDRKYWARHSRAGDLLKPIYFSSLIMNDKTQELKKCTSRFTHRRATVLSAPSGEIPERSKSFCE